MTDFLSTALLLAEQGYYVFPAEPGGKRPLVERGFRAATRDPDQIREWWEDWPNANPAIATGASDITVIDLDVDKETGECVGEDTWAVLQIEEDIAEPGMIVRTPRGGLHCYYCNNTGVPATSRRLGEGVDTRAGTGYVLAPGCVTADGTYELQGSLLRPEWLTETPEAIPRRIAEARSGLVGEHDDPSQWLAEVDLMVNVDRARKWLETEAKAGRVSIQGQGGHDLLYRTSAMLRDFALSPAVAGQLIQESGWNDACEPPWSPDEIETIVGNAYKYARRPAGSKATSQSSLDTMAREAENHLTDGNNVVQMKPKRKRFRSLDDDEIDEMEDPVWLVEDVIPEASISVVYGQSGSYKTFVALDIACCLAAGIPWQGHHIDGPKKVLYVAGEGAPGLKKRRKGWKQHRGFRKLAGFRLIPAMPRLLDPDDLVELIEEGDEVQPDCIVIDTVAHAMAGGDENAAKDASTFMAHVQRMAERWGCAVLLVHHAGKDESRGMRGSTAIFAASDAVLHISKEAGLSCEVAMTKQKDAEAIKPVTLKGTELTVGQDRRGKPIHTLVFDRVACGATRPEATTASDLDDDIAKGAEMAKRQVEAEWAEAAKQVLDDAWATDYELAQFPMNVRTLANIAADRLGVDREEMRHFLRESAWRAGRGLTEYVYRLVLKANRSRRCEAYAHPDWIKEAGDAGGDAP
jgi:KaiC/GvpD/RAD55 family RecA-like ATPase